MHFMFLTMACQPLVEICCQTNVKCQMAIKRTAIIAALLSVVPGLGHIYCGQNNKGAFILVAAIIIANLNILILPLIAIANPTFPVDDTNALWKYWIPRIVHDVVALWSIVFWIWVVADSYKTAKKLR